MAQPPKERNFATYIYKVLKQVHPDMGLSRKAMTIINDYVNDIFNQVMEHVVELCEVNKKGTATSREVQSGVRLALPGELAKHAVSEGTKAVTRFCCNQDSGKRMTQSVKAGLQFPVGRVKTLMKTKFSGRIGKGAPVYFAAVMEYMTAEVLELAGNAARDHKNSRITPRHVMLAIRGDDELDRMVQNATISSGGVIPHIHISLVPHRSHCTTSFGAPASGGFGAPASGGFGAPTSSGFGAPASGGFGAPASGGFGAPTSGGFGAPASGGFGAPASGGFGAPASSGFGAPASGGFGAPASGGFGY